MRQSSRLVTILLILAADCQFIQLVQSSSSYSTDGRGASLEVTTARQALLEELSGSHLRFSASIVIISR